MTYPKRPRGPEGEGEMTEHHLSKASWEPKDDDQSATKKSMNAIRTAFHDAGVEFHRRGERVGVTIVVWSQPR
jgi:hypothetical protein